MPTGQGHYILKLQSGQQSAHLGQKAEKLHFLIQKRLPVPLTYVCSWDAYEHYLAGGQNIANQVAAELRPYLDPGRPYAIRSSANLEDDPAHSFAGQFKSLLGVRGLDQVVAAVVSIWAAARSPAVEAYLSRHRLDSPEVKMAVIIQEQVSAVISGVAFSQNPLTGLNEQVIEAVSGSGELLVQAGVTPERWIYRGRTCLARSESARLDEAVIAEVASQTRIIAREYGRPVDLEWVYDGSRLYWVQLRDITTLNHLKLYSNRIAREMLPGMIRPLVWSINVPLIVGAKQKLLCEVLGRIDLDPDELVKAFYYRAYFNMGAIGEILERLGLPREAVEMMMGLGVKSSGGHSFHVSTRTLRYLPRLLGFIADKLRFDRKLRAALPAIQARYGLFQLDSAGQLSPADLLVKIDELYTLNQEMAYYNIVGPVLMYIYNGLLKRQLSRLGVDYASFDLAGGLAEFERFDPTISLAELNRQYRQLNPDLGAVVRSGDYEALAAWPDLAGFRAAVDNFIREFGHLSDSGNDFTAIPWRENRTLILQMIVNYTPPLRAGAPRVRFEALGLSPARRLLLAPLYRRARLYRLYRERISSLYTFGYGLFRVYFLALGDHLVKEGRLAARTDIFYLRLDEVHALVTGTLSEAGCTETITTRKSDMARYREVVLPEIIYGDQPPPVNPSIGSQLAGIPTSPGYFVGPTKVVKGLHQFDKLQPGEVLVVPYSDVGWAPLFARAGAVIAESGGMLSHSAIVAREYRIPAVVSVAGACSLPDNTTVTVDGYTGRIHVHHQEGS